MRKTPEDELFDVWEAISTESKRHRKASDELRTRFGVALKTVRTNKGLSLREFGSLLGFSAAFLSDVELGRRGLAIGHVRHMAEKLQ